MPYVFTNPWNKFELSLGDCKGSLASFTKTEKLRSENKSTTFFFDKDGVSDADD